MGLATRHIKIIEQPQRHSGHCINRNKQVQDFYQEIPLSVGTTLCRESTLNSAVRKALSQVYGNHEARNPEALEIF